MNRPRSIDYNSGYKGLPYTAPTTGDNPYNHTFTSSSNTMANAYSLTAALTSGNL